MINRRIPARRVNTCDYCGPGITHIIDPIAYPNDVIAKIKRVSVNVGIV